MFEAKLANAGLLKKIVESIKDLATDAPFECYETAMSFMAMDSSNSVLVQLTLKVGHFDTYRWDRFTSLGISLADMSKALKCANDDDTCMLKYEENERDSIIFTFTDPKHDRAHNVTVKMIDIIDSDYLGIPEQDYDVVCEMPAAHFQKTCKDLATFSDSLNITATKSGLVFTAKGDNGSSVVTYSPSSNTDDETHLVSLKVDYPVCVNFSIKYLNQFTKATTLGDRSKSAIVFTGKGDIGSSVVTYSPSSNTDDETQSVSLEVNDPVNVNFSIKYMNQFTKATTLGDRVRISLCNDVPIVVEYPIKENGYLKFYLPPKFDDDENMD